MGSSKNLDLEARLTFKTRQEQPELHSLVHVSFSDGSARRKAVRAPTDTIVQTFEAGRRNSAPRLVLASPVLGFVLTTCA